MGVKFPKNSLSKEELAKIPKPTLEEKETFPANATNSLIMVDSYLTGKNLCADEKVWLAQKEVQDNHK